MLKLLAAFKALGLNLNFIAQATTEEKLQINNAPSHETPNTMRSSPSSSQQPLPLPRVTFPEIKNHSSDSTARKLITHAGRSSTSHKRLPLPNINRHLQRMPAATAVISTESPKIRRRQLSARTATTKEVEVQVANSLSKLPRRHTAPSCRRSPVSTSEKNTQATATTTTTTTTTTIASAASTSCTATAAVTTCTNPLTVSSIQAPPPYTCQAPARLQFSFSTTFSDEDGEYGSSSRRNLDTRSTQTLPLYSS